MKLISDNDNGRLVNANTEVIIKEINKTMKFGSVVPYRFFLVRTISFFTLKILRNFIWNENLIFVSNLDRLFFFYSYRLINLFPFTPSQLSIRCHLCEEEISYILTYI